MIKELFNCIVSGFKYLKSYINRRYKDDYEDFIKWLISYD